MKNESKLEYDIEIDLNAKTDHSTINDKVHIPKYRVNHCFLLLFIFTMGINGICVAWTTGGNNQTADIFAAKLDWDADQTRFNNTLINFCSQIGKALGALYGGYIIPFGRKQAFIKYNILAIFSCLIMQIVSIWTLSIGKFLNGFFVTVVAIA